MCQIYGEEENRCFPYDHEIELTLCNMNRNLGIHDDYPNQNILAPVDLHGQLLPDNPGENKKGDKILLHALKNTTKVMIILQTLMGHLSCPLYHKATPLR